MALITMKELMGKLKLSKPTIIKLTKEGLPVIRIAPRIVRYDEDAVQKWMKERSEAREGVI